MSTTAKATNHNSGVGLNGLEWGAGNCLHEEKVKERRNNKIVFDPPEPVPAILPGQSGGRGGPGANIGGQ